MLFKTGFLQGHEFSKICIGNLLVWENTLEEVIQEFVVRNFPYPVGYALKDGYTSSQTYLNLLATGASITPENGMKFGHTHPSEFIWDWAEARAAVNFAKTNNQRIHGHTFWWAHPNTDATWLKDALNDPNPKQKLLSIMQAHTDAFAAQFKDDILSLDVINEAINPDGSLKNCIFKSAIGDDWMELAIKMVNIAMPNVKVFYNDFDIETGNVERAQAILALKARCTAIGATLHGVGFQMHTILRRDIDVMRGRFRMFSKAGMLVHISEFDVDTYNVSTSYTPALAEELAQFVYNVGEAYEKAVVPSLRWGITWWSVSDRENYKNLSGKDGNGNLPAYCTLYDYDRKPKLAYFRFLSLLGKPANTAIIYQDFELGDIASIDATVSTQGVNPTTWLKQGYTAGVITVSDTGIHATHNTVDSTTYPLLLSPVSNYILTSKAGEIFNPTNGNIRVMHLVFRYQDTSNYYTISALRNDVEGNYWALRKRKDGVDVTIAVSTVKPTYGDNIKVIVNGTTISAYINNTLFITVNDSDFMSAKYFGYRMKGHYDADKFSSWKNISLSRIQ